MTLGSSQKLDQFTPELGTDVLAGGVGVGKEDYDGRVMKIKSWIDTKLFFYYIAFGLVKSLLPGIHKAGVEMSLIEFRDRHR